MQLKTLLALLALPLQPVVLSDPQPTPGTTLHQLQPEDSRDETAESAPSVLDVPLLCFDLCTLMQESRQRGQAQEADHSNNRVDESVPGLHSAARDRRLLQPSRSSLSDPADKDSHANTASEPSKAGVLKKLGSQGVGVSVEGGRAERDEWAESRESSSGHRPLILWRVQVQCECRGLPNDSSYSSGRQNHETPNGRISATLRAEPLAANGPTSAEDINSPPPMKGSVLARHRIQTRRSLRQHHPGSWGSSSRRLHTPFPTGLPTGLPDLPALPELPLPQLPPPEQLQQLAKALNRY